MEDACIVAQLDRTRARMRGHKPLVLESRAGRACEAFVLVGASDWPAGFRV